jgi:hypothetical protein
MPKDDVEDKDDKGGKHKVTLTVVVGGSPVHVTANEKVPLRTIIPEALAKSGNVGQDPNEWELADQNGTPYDGDRKIEDLGLHDGSTVYLSRKAGGGG